MMKKRYDFRVGSLNLEQAFEEFITAKICAGVSHGTVSAYEGHFNAMRRFLDVEKDLLDLTDRDLQKAIRKMAETDLSRNTIHSYTATLSSFASWMRQEGLCDVKIALFKGEETQKPTYSRQDLERLLKRPKRGALFTEFRNWVIVNLLVNNGCRAGTVRAILVKDVDLDRGVIQCRHTKNRKQLSLPISPAFQEILVEYLKIRKGEPDDFLFPDLTGGQMSESCLHCAIKRYNRSRGVKMTSIHAFRHTFARMYLVDCGGNALKLQRLLGHSTLDMTKKYVRIFDEDLIDDFRRVSPLEAIKKAPRRASANWPSGGIA